MKLLKSITTIILIAFILNIPSNYNKSNLFFKYIYDPMNTKF